MVGLGLVDDFYAGSSTERVSVRRAAAVSASGASAWSVVELATPATRGRTDGGTGPTALEECRRGT